MLRACQSRCGVIPMALDAAICAQMSAHQWSDVFCARYLGAALDRNHLQYAVITGLRPIFGLNLQTFMSNNDTSRHLSRLELTLVPH